MELQRQDLLSSSRNQPRRGVEGEAPSGFAGGGGDASPYEVYKEAEDYHGIATTRAPLIQ